MFENDNLNKLQNKLNTSNHPVSIKKPPSCLRTKNLIDDMDNLFYDAVEKQLASARGHDLNEQSSIISSRRVNLELNEYDKVLLNYFKKLEAGLEIPQAHYTSHKSSGTSAVGFQKQSTQNELLFSEMQITKARADALFSLLGDTKDMSEFWVKDIVIDNCQISDENLAKIMEGLLL